MIDTDAIRARYDLRELAGQYTTLKRKTAHEMAGPCPKCGGRDRFYVTAEWFACRACHEKRGDVIAFLAWLEGLSFKDACERLADGELPTLPDGARRPAAAHTERLARPGETWQRKAKQFVADCQEHLWSDAGTKALAWLCDRQLDDGHILAAGLGYNPAERRENREAWGLEPDGDKRVWLPRAVVIPWEVEQGGDLWGVRFRLPAVGDATRYMSLPGGSNALYLAEFVGSDKPVVLCEGELDALTLACLAGDLVIPVATGSTKGARRPQWVARLALAPVVLVAYDNDDPGEKDADYWVGALSNAKRWRPYWKDANQMAQDGADLRAWVLAGMGG